MEEKRIQHGESSREMNNYKYSLEGSVHFTEGRWEIYFKAKQIWKLPYDKYPFVRRDGVSVTLVIDGNKYRDSASFHHYEGGKYIDSYIGSTTVRLDIPKPLREVLQKHSLDVHLTPVRLTFVGDTVYIKKIVKPKRNLTL